MCFDDEQIIGLERHKDKKAMTEFSFFLNEVAKQPCALKTANIPDSCPSDVKIVILLKCNRTK